MLSVASDGRGKKECLKKRLREKGKGREGGRRKTNLQDEAASEEEEREREIYGLWREKELEEEVEGGRRSLRLRKFLLPEHNMHKSKSQTGFYLLYTCTHT